MPKVTNTQLSFAVVFGGVIAFLLLALYAMIVGSLIWEVFQVDRAGQGQADNFAQGAITVVTTIGGLISALVVSKLAVTKPGDAPTVETGTASRANPSMTAKGMTVLYLTVWVAVGLAALVVGTVYYPDINSTVDDIGTSWLGLAIAAGYAYFNLDPTSGA
ncbi:MAG: hypothetical protein CL477_20290 [Acidobacteria bacterium]|nr:hypothetical protein [Acidobacteriota bacterium]